MTETLVRNPAPSGEVVSLYDTMAGRRFSLEDCAATMERGPAARFHIYAPQTMPYRPPLTNITVPPDKIIEYRLHDFIRTQYRTYPIFLAVLKDVDLTVPHMILMRPDGAVILESIPPWHRQRPLFFQGMEDYRAAIQPVGEVSEPVALIANFSLANYWHWLAQCLISVELLRLCGLLNRVRLVLPEGLTAWHLRSLALLGIDPSACLRLPVGRTRFKTLLYPSFLEQHRNGRFSPMLQDLFDTLKTAAWAQHRDRLATIPAPQRIYISRRDTPQRALENEAQLEDALAQQGYTIITPSHLSFDEQILVMRNALEIVAPHGAGMTNIVFAPRRTAVHELLPFCWGVSNFQSHALMQHQPYALYQSTDVTDFSSGHKMRWRLNLDDFFTHHHRFLDRLMIAGTDEPTK